MIKKGDKVIVVTGKDKGKKSTVKEVLSNGKIIVEGILMIKKHKKSTKRNEPGQIVEKESSIDASNVMLIDPKTDKRTRTKIKVVEGKKIRVSVKSGEKI